MGSAADTVIISFQYLMGLTNDARTNTPGVSDGNWMFRCTDEAQYTSQTQWLRQMTRDTNRHHGE